MQDNNYDGYDLIKRAKDGDKNAEETLVNSNIRLVWSIVDRIKQTSNVSSEDLFQIGCIGLLKAIKNFSLDKNVKFSTYAFPMILGEIKMFLREDGIIRIGRGTKDNLKKILAIKEKYERENDNEITMSILIKETGLSPDEITLALNSSYTLESIDEENDEGKPKLNIRDTTSSIEEEVIKKVLYKEILKKLTNIERKIILMRYISEKTQSDIGIELNITQVKVSRIEKAALGKIKMLLA